MLSGIKPLTITKRQAKELLSPKLVDRLIYAAKNFPEMGWLEILPKEEGKEVRETYIVYESLQRAFQRIRAGAAPIHESRLRLGDLLKTKRSADRWWSSDKADWKSVVVT